MDAFLTLDPHLTIVAWTAGAREILGWEAADVLGRPVFVLVPEDQRDAAAAALQQARDEGRVRGFHAERLTQRGQRVKVVADLLAVRNASGEHCATQITLRRGA